MSFKQQFESHFGLGVAMVAIVAFGSGVGAPFVVFRWASVDMIRHEEKQRLEKSVELAANLESELTRLKEAALQKDREIARLISEANGALERNLRIRFEEDVKAFTEKYPEVNPSIVYRADEPLSVQQAREAASAEIARLASMAISLHLEESYRTFFAHYGYGSMLRPMSNEDAAGLSGR